MSMNGNSAFALAPWFREMIWGATALEPWFPNPDRRIGEVWFGGDVSPGGGCSLPILIKFLFAAERLSVQVHPPEEYARAHDDSAGKTEMWHILAAGEGAAIALGLREPVSRARLREAALSGEIEGLLNWVPVAAGDSIFAPAGTIHAIGPGIVLCEIQQNSDLTYRLYDYGRGRPLHLDKALDVANLEPHPGKIAAVRLSENVESLVRCPYFVADRVVVGAGRPWSPDGGGQQFLVVLRGGGRLGGQALQAGQVWLIPPGGSPPAVETEDGAELLRARVPAGPGRQT